MTCCKGRSRYRRSEGLDNEIFIWVITLLEYGPVMYKDTKKTKIHAKYMVRQSFLISRPNMDIFPEITFYTWWLNQICYSREGRKSSTWPEITFQYHKEPIKLQAGPPLWIWGPNIMSVVYTKSAKKLSSFYYLTVATGNCRFA